MIVARNTRQGRLAINAKRGRQFGCCFAACKRERAKGPDRPLIQDAQVKPLRPPQDEPLVEEAWPPLIPPKTDIRFCVFEDPQWGHGGASF
jgi:hypothetical protein